MRFLLLGCFLFLSLLTYSQNPYRNEINLLSDNDLYTSIVRDRYYTNGLFITYKHLTNNLNHPKTKKKIHSFGLGHMLYTPVKATLQFASLHDRPFAGYLYGTYGIENYYKNQNIFKFSIQLGFIGEKAKGKEVQNFIHGIYNYPKAMGWDYQIKEALAINASLKYIKNISKISNTKLDFNSYSTLNIGTIFTDVATGLYGRIGFKELQKNHNTVAFGSNLNTSKSTTFSESFIFIKPLLHYVLYDATIQGSFLNTGSPVTYNVMPFKFTLELGYLYSYNRFSYGYVYHYHTKKLKSNRVKNGNNYGSISISYYFN